MRIAVEVQGALTRGSRTRGIGRYTRNFVSALAKARGDDDMILMANDGLSKGRESALLEVSPSVAATSITHYKVPHAEHFASQNSSARRRVAEAIVKRHVAELRPDVLLFTSIFEQAFDDFSPIAIRSYPCKISAAIVYDLIPLVFEDGYLRNSLIRRSYYEILESLKAMDILLAISESTRQDAISRLGIDPERIFDISGAADDRFRKLDFSAARREEIAARVGLKRPFVLYVAGGDMRKNLRGAIAAFACLPEDVRKAHQLLLVTNLDVAQCELFFECAAEWGMEADGLVVTRGIDDDDMVALLNTSSALLFCSLYEGFGLPVLEAMHCGTPIVASNNSSIPEIVDRQDILFPATDPAAAARVLTRVLTDEALRLDLAEWGPRRARTFTWERTATRALAAIKSRLPGAARSRSQALACELLDVDGARAELADILVGAPQWDGEIRSFVADLLFSVPTLSRQTPRRLLVDVTDCRLSGAWTGIQRVVRKLVTAFYDGAASGPDFIPVAVRLDESEPRSAPDFVAATMGRDVIGRSYPVEVREGDDLFMLDSNWIAYPTYTPLFEEIRRHRGRVFTCIYDIIPELHPDLCGEGMPEAHSRWLHSAVAESDGLICISRSVADEVSAYIMRMGLPHRPGLKIGWFHCGSDLHRTAERRPAQPRIMGAFDARRPTFLAVGTLEPRKAHALALDAFELLWDRGIDATLCFIGARGWKIRHLEARIRSHREHGVRLFWFADARDADVTYAYDQSAAIICMSTAEGFGLPIVEAARLGRPVICSDIPVFREVGGEGAAYFRSGDPQSFAEVVEGWLGGRSKADPTKVSSPSWQEAAERIREIIYLDDWYATLS